MKNDDRDQKNIAVLLRWTRVDSIFDMIHTIVNFSYYMRYDGALVQLIFV